ncbi:MAG: hypothetical protein IJ682_00150 [Lachnospiraceae bacterium]|nr:hypothetical protein [Lachnospiraceae bacterium]
MRITNTMISDNAALNINGNKISVDANNTKMTTQKKINRPSEDPVIAVRSLKLQTSLAKINQYYEKNIPDADSWLDVTETALLNIRDIMTDVRTLAVRGATDTLTEEDRKTIYTQLKKLQEQCFAEGNADYAGRTVFTGFRTDKNLVFMNDDKNTTYDIEEQMEAVNMTKSRFYTNEVEMPTNPTMVEALTDAYKTAQTIEESDYYKLRLSYNLNQGGTTSDSVTALNFYTNNKDGSMTLRNTIDLTQATTESVKDADSNDVLGADGNAIKYQVLTVPQTAADGWTTGSAEDAIQTVYQFDTEADWAAWSEHYGPITDPDEQAGYDSAGVKFDTDGYPRNKFVPAGAVVIIRETGDAVFSEDAATSLMTDKVNLSFDYTKTGFNKGELRPEYYFDSVLRIDENGNQMGEKSTEFTKIDDASGANPAEEGWYIFTKGQYVRSTDTTPEAGRTYYKAGDTTYAGIRYDRYEKSPLLDEDGNKVTDINGNTVPVLTKQALYSIDYTISQNQTLGVNLEAEECFNHDIYQDMSDMIDAVSKAMAAHDKVEKIKEMQKEDQYQADPYPEKLSAWLEIAQKEMDYYDNNLSKLYSSTLGSVDGYLSKINLAITDLGCRSDQLKLTEKRMSDQQETVEELKSNNDNLDLSQIIMDYTSSYTAYQSSLVAAGKLGEQTLLNYI